MGGEKNFLERQLNLKDGEAEDPTAAISSSVLVSLLICRASCSLADKGGRFSKVVFGPRQIAVREPKRPPETMLSCRTPYPVTRSRLVEKQDYASMIGCLGFLIIIPTTESFVSPLACT